MPSEDFMITLGLVGNPASGKSTVAKYLQSRGAHWIDADAVAKEVLQSPQTRPALMEAFGTRVIRDDRINRDLMAELVFGDDPASRASLKTLQSIVHPPTRRRILNRLSDARDAGYVMSILDVPLMFESQWDLACDSIWCIDAPLARRKEWASQRGWPPGQLERREANQWPIAQKARLSNVLLLNEGTLDDLHLKIDGVLSVWSGCPTACETPCWELRDLFSRKAE